MRFNVAFLCVFLGAAQLVAAVQPAAPAPAAPPDAPKKFTRPKWNGQDTQGTVVFAGANCVMGAFVCDATGHRLGKLILSGGAYCCVAYTGAIIASRSDNWKVATEKLGDKAKVTYDKAKKAAVGYGGLIMSCPGGVCRMVKNSKATQAVVKGVVKGVNKGVNKAKAGWGGVKKHTKNAAGNIKKQFGKLRRPGRNSQSPIPLTNSPRPRPRSINGPPVRRNNQLRQRRYSYRKMKRSPSLGMHIRSRKPMNIDYYY